MKRRSVIKSTCMFLKILKYSWKNPGCFWKSRNSFVCLKISFWQFNLIDKLQISFWKKFFPSRSRIREGFCYSSIESKKNLGVRLIWTKKYVFKWVWCSNKMWAFCCIIIGRNFEVEKSAKWAEGIYQLPSTPCYKYCLLFQKKSFKILWGFLHSRNRPVMSKYSTVGLYSCWLQSLDWSDTIFNVNSCSHQRFWSCGLDWRMRKLFGPFYSTFAL